MARVVRVVTDVAAVDRPFDYLVPNTLAHVAVGDRVRMNFHGRSTRGWVVADVEEAETLASKPLVKWLGYGPPSSLVPLLEWAAWRWAAPVARFFLATTPSKIVSSLPTAPAKVALAAGVAPTTPFAPGVWQLAPTTDPLGLILSAYEQTRGRDGTLLVLVPTEGWAQRLRGRLEQRGLAVAAGDEQWDRMRAQWPIVVGTRGDAFAPTPRLSGAVVIDADDDSFRSEASPTWDATSVVAERCRRDDAPLWVTSVLPSPSLLTRGPLWEAAPADQWPTITVIDQRQRDPHDGVLAPAVLAAARRALEGPEAVAVAVVLQRLGTGRLLACKKCGELSRCDQCGQPEGEVEGRLVCPDGHGERENFCLLCGATNLRRVKTGVTTLARDVGALLHHEVLEVTAATTSIGEARVVVGTEAVFGRVRRCGLVVFVDFDQYLLAPRADARRDAVDAVARAARLVGAHGDGRGSIALQTRRDDDVTSALLARDLRALLDDDREVAEVLGLPPYGALAEISGEGAEVFLSTVPMDQVKCTSRGDVTVVRAPTVEQLCDALGQGTRGAGRLRVAVW